MHRFLIAAVLAVAACSHSTPKPVEPAGVPPLPPSSGTPIGILLDEATRLHLRDDQLAKLREIDSGLAARNDKLESDLRPVAHDPTTTSPNPMMTGGHRGGGRRGRHGGAGPANHPPQAGPDQASQAKATDERVANTRDALARAFEVLDPAQRPDAEKLLAEHGVDLAPKKVAAGSGSAAQPDDDGDGDDGSTDEP